MSEKSISNVGLIGLGLMGRGMGHSLIRAGFKLGVLAHRRRHVAEELLGLGAWEAKTPAELAAKCDAVVLCVSSAQASQQCILGDRGLLEGGHAGLVVIESSTLMPAVAVEVAARLRERGIQFVDAPVTLGPREAMVGKLNGLVGGEAAAVERARVVLEAYCSQIFVMGGVGRGYSAKLLNNFLSFINFASVAEAVSTALKADLDIPTLLKAINVSGGQSRALDNITPWLATGAETKGIVTLATAHKDVSYYAAFAKELGTEGPIAEMVVGLLGDAVKEGLGDWLTRAYVKRVAAGFGLDQRLPEIPAPVH